MGVLLLTFAIHAIGKLREAHDHRQVARHPHHHFIEFGRERDMFFIPGDRRDDEYDESEDL